MPKEIERKWLIDPRDIPGIIQQQLVWTPIVQRYLPQIAGDTEMRIRVKGTSPHTLTIKTGRGLVREEIETTITEDMYHALAAAAPAYVLKERAHTDAVEGTLSWSIDSYTYPRPGLHVVEIEFVTEEYAHAFEAPDWFGEEITGVDEYRNESLAIEGLGLGAEPEDDDSGELEEAYRQAARKKYEREGELEIDEGALVSLGADPGAYIQAWVWIYNDALSEDIRQQFNLRTEDDDSCPCGCGCDGCCDRDDAASL